MASVVAASQAIVSVPSSFSGLRAASSSEAAARAPVVSVSSSPALSRPLSVARASLPEAASKSVKSVLSIAAGAALAASLAMSVPAMAADVVMGLDDGSLKFSPEVVELKAGEKINFINNAGFPHNVIFDEDEVPEGVNATAISMSDEDLLNSKGETFSVVLTTPGKYSFYCSPHQGAGMKGTAIVN